jgi:tetratricopeptide (TPR) repeat protein
MTNEVFSRLDDLQQADGGAAVIDNLIETLRERKEYHRLFDAALMKKKFELGLPLTRPTSFDDVPDENEEEFRSAYVAAAREAGQAFLDDNQISPAWVYFRSINEPEVVRNAIEELQPNLEADETTEELINVALYEGANPVKGLQILLKTHGTCNTITAMDQALPQLSAEDRIRAAALLVRELYEDLSHTLRSEVEQRMALVPPGDSLRELIAGREWLFEEGNYHIDVSHIHSVIRFARSLNSSCPELALAIEMTEYGSQLDEQFQYPGDPPFEEYYLAHRHFFQAIKGEKQDEAIAYFQQKLDKEPDEPDKQLVAYVMVDLLIRMDRQDAALDLAEKFLSDMDDPDGFSFSELCREAGRMDTLRRVARKKGDLVSYTAALIQGSA